MERISLIFALIVILCGSSDEYKVGLGRSDVTGPSVEIAFMGYAQIKQRGQGIHTRQYARTFIVEDNLENRIVFVSVDAGMISHVVKRNVIGELEKKYGNLYTFDNVMISGTHTHSGPAGFHMYVLYDLTSLGFVSETFIALVHGITQSIITAHNSMVEGRIFISETEINNANINRSPWAYENNPEEEKAQYKDNTDKTLIQLRFMDKNNEKVLGAFNWFPVHATSMNSSNKLISSDNVGYASILLEQEYNINKLVGKGNFVGAFCSANLGDVSPNIKGAKCQKTGLPCDKLTSACPHKDICVASGPGRDISESTKIIGTRIYKGASFLLATRIGRELIGSVSFIHQFIDMPQQFVTYFNPKLRIHQNFTGCLPAMGYSFAAGTTDGPGAFDFTQGTTSDNPFWNAVRDFIAEPSEYDITCHGSKPILIATGRASFPYSWQPTIVPTQIFQIGDALMFGVPGEFTTMAGRRLKAQVQKITKNKDIGTQAIVCGLSNMYTSYITTPEEYEIQRYEAASTIFGPHTLSIYIEQFSKLLSAMISKSVLKPGPMPPDQDEKQISLMTKVYYDGYPYGSGFGYVIMQPKQSYNTGELLKTSFVAANPRNNLMSNKSFFYVERLNPDGNWKVVATDADWETKFMWQRVSMILGQSEIEFHWEIPKGTKSGEYRVRHNGFYRYILGGTYPYQEFEMNLTVEKDIINLYTFEANKKIEFVGAKKRKGYFKKINNDRETTPADSGIKSSHSEVSPESLSSKMSSCKYNEITRKSDNRKSSRLQTIEEEQSKLSHEEKYLLKVLKDKKLITSKQSTEDLTRIWLPNVLLRKLTQCEISRLINDWSFVNKLHLIDKIKFRYEVIASRNLKAGGGCLEYLVKWFPENILDDEWIDENNLPHHGIKIISIQNLSWKQKQFFFDH
ncbi:CLUMA_CG020983, isoform A [Clunio marinus]|uniref:Neutral ceramidase n=1 Tax=Clunio marinus TaxID=568069 RepID=A0A1J1J8W7_9DIPT|nr:CLUMA_CG020983, isoform A [Clunio marinus]